MNMLKKLRHTFIFTNMLLVILVLALVFGTVCVVNYNQKNREVKTALEKATNAEDTGGSSASATTTTSDALDALTGAIPQSAPDDTTVDSRKSNDGEFIALCSYVVDSSGNVIVIGREGFSIDEDTLNSAISQALESDDESGRLTSLNLFYQVRTTSNGAAIAFVSTDYVDKSILSLVLTLASVGLCALVAFFLISLFLSRWALKPVEHAWAQQQQFVADASHELKTPLTVILANNSILMSHPEDSIDSQMKWIESSDSEAHLMQGLVDDLLFLAKPENQQPQQTLGSVDLSDLIERNVLQFESVAYEKKIELESDIEQGIFLEGNESSLQRLVGILVDNACKYANEGGVVTASLKRKGSHVEFSVRNTGEAIAEEDLPHIFDRFYRADKARTRTAGGYGLGLAIAKEVVEEHKGEITAQSTLERGTVFTVTFTK